MEMFDVNTDPKLREQIFKYWVAGLMTDYERAALLGLHRSCRIREGAKILMPEKLTCGKYVWIGEGAILDAQGGLSIGDYTQIGLNVMIWSHTTHKQAFHGKTGISQEGKTYTSTKVGSCCFIAGPSVILPGVTIGDRVLVPPMSVVEKDLPDDSIYQSSNRKIKLLTRRIDKLEALVDQLLNKNK